MKTYIFSFLITVTFTLFLSGCDIIGSYERGNGNVTTTTRPVGSFDRISLGGNFEVILRKSSENLVTITTDENLEPLIEVRVNNGELEISSNKKLISIKKSKIEIGYNYINEIRVYGATHLTNIDLLESDKLTLKLEGAGVIDMQLKVAKLDARLSGAGIVKFNGVATDADVSLSGAGGLEAFGLETMNFKIDVSGLGSAKINVKNELTATIAGVGGIQYSGHPTKVNKNVSGVGSIKEENHDHDDSVI